MRGFDASLLKIETLLTWLDANDPNGPMTQYFFRPFKEGQAKMEKLQEKFAKQIQENVPLHLKLKEATENRWLTDEYGNMMPIKRTNMFGIAGLFFGNEESRKKLLDGYKWNEQDVYEYLLTNMKSIDDWHYLDSIYRVWDELTAEKSNVYRQVRGYGWEPPPAMTYFDRYGNERKGGYWSIVDSDSDSTQFREQQGLVDRRQFNPLPSATVQLESTKGMLRPSLDFETLGYRIKETLHDISFRPAVVNALRMLEDRQILGLVKDSYGKEYGDTIERWVSDMANDSGWRDDIGATVATKLFRYVGQAAIVHLVGFSPATAIIHSGSAAANTVGELKWQSISATYKVVGDTLLKSSDMLFRNPRNLELATNFAWENSPELQSRWNKDNFNLVKALGHWSNLQTIQWSYNRWAQSFISLTDYMTAVVAWHAQYTNSTNDGKSHEDAVFMADRLVRAAHGGVSQLDKAAIQRSLNLAPFTMFYGYFNHNYNQFRRFSHEINEGTAATKQEFMNDEYGKIAKRMSGPFWQGMMYFAAYGLVPALIHEAVRGKEEEEFDLPSFLGKAVLSQGAGMVPFFRDFAYSFLHPGVQSGGIPLMQVWGAAGTISRGAKKVWEGEWPKPSEAQALLIPLKLGSKTLGRFADYMFDSEQDAPRNVREWKNLTIYGQPTMPGVRRKKARPARTGHDYRQ
jgi:hypothetical protein